MICSTVKLRICADQNMKNISIKKYNIDSKSSNIIQIFQKIVKLIKIIFKKSVQENLEKNLEVFQQLLFKFLLP